MSVGDPAVQGEAKDRQPRRSPAKRPSRIAVVAVAAESGGALSILHGLHSAVMADGGDRWTFFTSIPELQEGPAVENRRFPGAKRSPAHRIWFDQVILPKMLRDLEPDVVVSLQNVPVSGTDAPQVVYLHQALPFADYRFQPLREPKLWLYDRITRARIGRGLRSEADIVVQTEWMREAVASRREAYRGQVVAIPPPAQLSSIAAATCESQTTDTSVRFFYPASAQSYKNHRVLVEAVDLLDASAAVDFEVVLTLTEDEFRSLGLGTPSARIRLVGQLTREEVESFYRDSCLVFPSLVETVGLPLVEGMATGARIIAADLPYAREQVGAYEGATFFDPEDAEQLRTVMSTTSRDGARFMPVFRSQGSWNEFLRFVRAAASRD